MDCKKCMECAGDLFEEVSEISKTIPSIDSIEVALSHTAGCGNFFTIYCC